MQFRASFSGAVSRLGNVEWCRKANKREVIASIRVSKFDGDASRVRRMSFAEKRVKTSSVDSGSCQNYKAINAMLTIVEAIIRQSSMDHLLG